MFNRPRSPIGLDLGAHSVKLLQLTRAGEGLAVAAAAQATLPADLPADGPVRTAALVEIIRPLLTQAGFKGKQVISCLPDGCVQYKSVRLPRMPEEELRNAVQWEARERLKAAPATASATAPGATPGATPAVDGEMIVQFYDAGEVRQGEDVREEIIVMAAAAPAVQAHLDLLLRCGLQPTVFDGLPGALTRALVGEAAPDVATFVLDVGYAGSKVLIARGRRILFYKPIDLGGQKLDQAVAAKLNLPLADAADLRRRLQQSGTATDENGTQPLFGAGRRENVERAVFDAVRPVLGELAREVGLCLRYYGVTFRGRRPETALLAGGEASDPHLAKVLAEDVGLTVAPAQPLAGADLSAVTELATGSGATSLWTVAMGLCRRDLGAAAQRSAA